MTWCIMIFRGPSNKLQDRQQTINVNKLFSRLLGQVSKTRTVMMRLALHLFAPSIGSSFDIFLSDSFTKSPLHSQVTWSSSVWKRGGKQLVKLSRTRTTKKRVTGCVKDWKCSSRIRGWISWGTYLWLGVCMNVSFQDQGVGIRLEQQGLLVHPASWQN